MDNSKVSYVRIDNLPPGKSWRQVKYMVGGMIHHTSILQVKMLPPVQSIVPPFMPFQSCIVSLKRSDGQLNRLLMDLNGYTWEYYQLMAYAVPPLHAPNNAAFMTVPNTGLDHLSPPPSAASSSPTPAPPPAQLMMPFAPMPPMYYPAAARPQPLSRGTYLRQQNQQYGKKMRQVFSEESFRRQMSARGMHQLLLGGFPPCLHWDVNGNYELNTQESDLFTSPPAIHIKTEHPEYFGKLKWTVLKDFIKLKCEKLLEMETLGVTANTREFYVGVYEDTEAAVDVKVLGSTATNSGSSDSEGAEGAEETSKANDETTQIEGSPDEINDTAESLGHLSLNSSHRVVSATIYKAIVGFHSRELCDMCRDSLQGQEYSLGYKLTVTELSPLMW
ncbi:LAME_0F13806g1_1 [Lachancea meyersii CBS 8951]|uniref:LAME_0F13806g1_1 n=1 Tax=Lachancea meyersii CBS 8951 TaxID=1266667 RepID=A0A1G4JXP4_9SACH|nr:LAME_0F13806g1_1 [Lachancea meyersii CBS 8951]